MNKVGGIILVLALMVPVAACSAKDAEVAKPETLEDRFSYSYGQRLGNSFQQQDVKLNLDLLKPNDKED